MAAENPATDEVQEYKDEQMLELIRETVGQLEELGSRLEEYAKEQIDTKNAPESGEKSAGETS
jgi:hypothetical protein